LETRTLNKMKNTHKGKKILVTGGAGYIGLNLVNRLVDSGFEVVVVDDLSSGHKKYLNKIYKQHHRTLVHKFYNHAILNCQNL